MIDQIDTTRINVHVHAHFTYMYMYILHRVLKLRNRPIMLKLYSVINREKSTLKMWGATFQACLHENNTL